MSAIDINIYFLFSKWVEKVEIVDGLKDCYVQSKNNIKCLVWFYQLDLDRLLCNEKPLNWFY